MRPLTFLCICLVAAGTPFLKVSVARSDTVPFPGFPTTFEGQPLVRAPLTAVEEGFLRGFPGVVGRFSAGVRAVILRWVSTPTRKLHPATDCYRGSGYSVVPDYHPTPQWGSFYADNSEVRLHVRERIWNARGQSRTDPSSWYWDAILGRSTGPWWAATVAEPALEAP